MGWDAYAVHPDGTDVLRMVSGEGFSKHPSFVLAATVLTDVCGQVVDNLFVHGGLDCSACGVLLGRATGMDCWPEGDPPVWSAAQVQRLARTADWNFEVHAHEVWAKLSARAFLETCAAEGLSIRFSW